jgi:excisionase family DNA binding protein
MNMDFGMNACPIAVTVADACERLSCSRTTLYHLLDLGELRSFKIGRSRRVLMSSINEYIKRRVSQEPELA